jgi:hypothetical protein
VQPDGGPNLLQHEFTVALARGRGQAFRAAGNLNRVGIHDTDPLEELRKAGVEAVVKAPDYRRVAQILLARRIEMENLSHHEPLEIFAA